MDSETSKKQKKLRRWCNNLVLALLGRNPYALELERVTHEYQQTASVVEKQREQIYKLETKLAKLAEQVKAFQNLTENLRQRVTDKDIVLEQERRDRADAIRRLTAEHETVLKAQQEQHERDRVDRHEEYEERMSERDAKIQALREDLDATLEQLQNANRALGRECLAQAMLDKTNNGLEDLLSAMQSGEEEKLLMATQYLDWSNYLPCIAQQYLQVLRRKNELVERLHFTEQGKVKETEGSEPSE